MLKISSILSLMQLKYVEWCIQSGRASLILSKSIVIWSSIGNESERIELIAVQQ